MPKRNRNSKNGMKGTRSRGQKGGRSQRSVDDSTRKSTEEERDYWGNRNTNDQGREEMDSFR